MDENQPDAPVAVSVIEGQWQLREDSPQRPRFARTPVLAYQALAFPRLNLNLVRLECSLGGGQQIAVMGLVPAQRFPQPPVTVAIGEHSWSAIPNARYHGRVAPMTGPSIPESMLDDNLKGANLSFPGHPAYADLTFFRHADPEMLEALRSSAPIRVTFEGQERVYPAVPADMAARYAEACADLSLSRLSAR